MFNVNGFNATLVQNNRHTDEDMYYDDQDKQEITIKVCPYEGNQAIKFGIDTEPEAKGYFIVKRTADIKEGDQIEFNGKTFTILDVRDNWIFNRIESFTVAVK